MNPESVTFEQAMELLEARRNAAPSPRRGAAAGGRRRAAAAAPRAAQDAAQSCRRLKWLKAAGLKAPGMLLEP